MSADLQKLSATPNSWSIARQKDANSIKIVAFAMDASFTTSLVDEELQ